MNDLAIYGYSPSTDLAYSETLVALDNSVRAAALAEIENLEESGEIFTATEREAVLIVQELKTINGIDLAALLMRATRIRKIRDENFVTRHPGQYATLAELASDNGMSMSELSNILDLVDIIFPYLAELGFSIPILWEDIGKSKFRELCPVLKCMATGQESGHTTTKNTVDRLMEDAYATARGSGEDIDDEGAREIVTRQIIEDAELLTIPRIRQQMRPTRTPLIHGSVVRTPDRNNIFVSMLVSEDQWILMQRVMGRHFEHQTFTLSDQESIRQEEVTRVPEVRWLLREVGQ